MISLLGSLLSFGHHVPRHKLRLKPPIREVDQSKEKPPGPDMFALFKGP